MLEETYFKFKKNILPKMKKMQPNFQEPVVEYCEPDQVIDICSYNHYSVIDQTNEGQRQHNNANDIYDTSELEHEFEYGIYEDVFKTEQLMAKLKHIDKAERESKKLRDLEFRDFPLEQFSDAGKVANEGDPYLKAAVDTKLYDLEKCAIQIDMDKNNYEHSSEHTDDSSSPSTEETCNPNTVSHMQPKTVSNQYHVEQSTDQHMYRTMKMARNFCCRKPLICLVKTILNSCTIHYLKVCVTMSMKVLNKAILTLKYFNILRKQVKKTCTSSGGLCRLSLPSYSRH